MPNRMVTTSMQFPVHYNSDGKKFIFTNQDRYNVSNREKEILKFKYIQQGFDKLSETVKNKNDFDSIQRYTRKFQEEFDAQFHTDKGDVADMIREFLKMKKEWSETTNPPKSDRPRRS